MNQKLAACLLLTLGVCGLPVALLAQEKDPEHAPSQDSAANAPAAALVAGPRLPQVRAGLRIFFDTREFQRYKWIGTARSLPGELNFFGFVDLDTHRGELVGWPDRYFTELRAWRKIAWNVGPAVEFNRGAGRGQVLRTGILWDLPMRWVDPGMVVSLKIYPLETDGDGGQVSWSYRVPLPARLTIEGWLDLNVVRGRLVTVTETLLRAPLWKRLDFLVEYRHSGSPPRQRTGVAFGVELGLWK